ncbi:hypothetical protein [Thauera sinica]|uniref:Uncharacterized protein n=1 Tax=Thauera sinica TaxID=2665146 RepID=A0ABW1AVY0_9RHOO|nr:hypothetical protein [Thauera sp. K11]
MALNLEAIARTLHTIVRRLLVRRGLLVENEGTPYLSELPDVGDERLVRYVARPVLANERVSYDEGMGRVTLHPCGDYLRLTLTSCSEEITFSLPIAVYLSKAKRRICPRAVCSHRSGESPAGSRPQPDRRSRRRWFA